MTGYRALYESAAWFDVASRSKLRVTGEDRASFIHAMSTNVVETLSPGEGTQTLFLNARGHIQADALVLVDQECLLLDFESCRRKSLPVHLDKYVVMDDVHLENLSPPMATIAIEGPKADYIVSKIAALPPPGNLRHISGRGFRVVRKSLSGQPGFWLLVPNTEKKYWAQKAEDAGTLSASEDDWQILRVENKIPLEGVDYLDKSIPQQANRLCAVSFSKGCYLGQEIVERVRSRGNLNRILLGIEIDSTEPLSPDSPVLWQDKEVGHLTSPIFSPTVRKILAFSFLRAEVPHDAALTVGGCAARVRQ